VKRPTASELDTLGVARKSLVAARAIRAGETLAPDAVAIKRPGTGISPADLSKALGRPVRRHLVADEVIDWTALG
jgi:sialic acid synthase SpsE